MNALDPKDRVRVIIRHAFHRLPRTRSGKGWYLSQRGMVEFTEDIVRTLFSASGIAFLDVGFDFEEAIIDILTNKSYPSEQQYGEGLIRAIAINSEGDIRKIIANALDTLPRQAWVNRYVSNETRKEEFISKIVDDLFKGDGPVIIDTMDNILQHIVPILNRMRRIVSAQECAQALIAELKIKYTKKNVVPYVGLII